MFERQWSEKVNSPPVESLMRKAQMDAIIRTRSLRKDFPKWNTDAVFFGKEAVYKRKFWLQASGTFDKNMIESVKAPAAETRLTERTIADLEEIHAWAAETILILELVAELEQLQARQWIVDPGTFGVMLLERR